MPDQPVGINPNVVRALNTDFLIHSVRSARCHYTLQFSGTVNIATTAAQSGSAQLQYTWDGVNWIIAGEVGASITVGLAIALSLAQGDKKELTGEVPAGVMNVKIVTSVTGGMTITYVRGQEIVY